MSQTLELFQFPYSHYNEKARWALDWKGIPHTRTNLLPGPHMPRVRRMTGLTTVPVLRIGEELVWESARIIDALERRQPDPPLYPADPSLREQALAVQRRFDDEIGPLVRRSLFASMLEEPDYICSLFSFYRPTLQRLLYRASFPLAKGMMKKGMGISDHASVEAAHAETDAALGWVAAESAATGYLVGDAFGVADLTAAALLAPCANPPDSPMFRPDPMPAAIREWTERWSTHPGSDWVRRVYREHRAPPGVKLRHARGGVSPSTRV